MCRVVRDPGLLNWRIYKELGRERDRAMVSGSSSGVVEDRPNNVVGGDGVRRRVTQSTV